MTDVRGKRITAAAGRGHPFCAIKEPTSYQRAAVSEARERGKNNTKHLSLSKYLLDHNELESVETPHTHDSNSNTFCGARKDPAEAAQQLDRTTTSLPRLRSLIAAGTTSPGSSLLTMMSSSAPITLVKAWCKLCFSLHHLELSPHVSAP